MTKKDPPPPSPPPPPPPRAVREPAQVYLAPDDRDLLARLALGTNLSKAEILRRGIRSFAREQQGTTSPMLTFVRETTSQGWPADGAMNHDALLAESYVPPTKKRR